MILAPQLRERNLGIYEGGPNAVWKAIMRQSPVPFHLFQPPGGESYSELQERVGVFFYSLLKKHRNDTLLFVSHTGVLTMLLLRIFNKYITKENYEAYKPGNTAVTICEVSQTQPPFIQILNDIDHIAT